MSEGQEQTEEKRFRGEEGDGYVNVRVSSILGVSMVAGDKLDAFPQFFIPVGTFDIHNLPSCPYPPPTYYLKALTKAAALCLFHPNPKQVDMAIGQSTASLDAR